MSMVPVPGAIVNYLTNALLKYVTFQWFFNYLEPYSEY